MICEICNQKYDEKKDGEAFCSICGKKCCGCCFTDLQDGIGNYVHFKDKFSEKRFDNILICCDKCKKNNFEIR